MLKKINSFIESQFGAITNRKLAIITVIVVVLITSLHYRTEIIELKDRLWFLKAEIKRPLILELFTSQNSGISVESEAVLEEISKERKDLFILAHHIDYWDDRNWRDILAIQESSARQAAYIRGFRAPNIYIPQVVIDGTAEFPASITKDQILEVVKYSKRQAVEIPLEIKEADKNSFILNIAAPDKALKKKIKLVDILAIRFKKSIETKVTGGENNGKTLVQANVVKAIHQLGPWDKEAISMPFSIPELKEGEGIVVIFQERMSDAIELPLPGRIIASAYWYKEGANK